MTNRLFKHFLLIAIVVASATFSNAQNQPKGQNPPDAPKFNKDMNCQMGYFGIPDLTPEQKTKFDDLKLQHIKDVTPLKNQMKEKQARINTLFDADKADMTAINTAIDEFTAISNQLLKKKIEFKLSVRNLLNDKQKIVYDSRSDLFEEGCCMEGSGKKGHDKCTPGPGPGAGPRHFEHDCPKHK